eukprot:gb/GECG01015426.1/.p1 GENE.gb/GECG01015426.1/~~gb/GECG01015426.1/.p1  ORF type:complete len:492 (+),score=84.23 gb/GECG01015426.1/:1-1476(+)
MAEQHSASSSSQHDQDGAVAQFVAITGANEQIAKHTLESANWNIEQAVNIYMETNDSTSFPQLSSSSSSQNNLVTHETQVHGQSSAASSSAYDEEGVREAIPSRQERLLAGPGYAMPQEDFRMPQVVDAFRDFSSGKGRQKKRDLSTLFSPPQDLILPMVFHEAQAYAANEKRWLLVNLQDEKEFDSHRLNRDTWSSLSVKDYIRHYFCFWQQWSTVGDAKKVIDLHKLDTSKLPAMLIIDPRTGELVWQRVGFIEPTDLLNQLCEFISVNPFNKKGPPTIDIQDGTRSPSESSGKRKRASDREEARAMEQAIAESLAQRNDDDVEVLSEEEEEDEGNSYSSDDEVIIVSGEQPTKKDNYATSTTSAESRATNGDTESAKPTGRPVNVTEDEGADASKIKVLFPDGNRKIVKLQKTRNVARLYALVAATIGVQHSIGNRCEESLSGELVLQSDDQWDLETAFPAETLSKYAHFTIEDAKLHGASVRVIQRE